MIKAQLRNRRLAGLQGISFGKQNTRLRSPQIHGARKCDDSISKDAAFPSAPESDGPNE